MVFRWIVERECKVTTDYRHDWDRFTNRYQVEGTNRQKQHIVVLFNTQTKVGDVYLDGAKLAADSTKTKMMEMAYRRFINDSYWLIMPYKLNDPGVILNYDGEKKIDDKIYSITFHSLHFFTKKNQISNNKLQINLKCQILISNNPTLHL